MVIAEWGLKMPPPVHEAARLKQPFEEKAHMSSGRGAMKRIQCLIVLLVALLASCTTVQVKNAQEITASAPTIRFAPEIEAFLKEDRINPPPQQAILFIGSSIFREWTHLKEQMDPLPVFNRAFGGSWTADILQHMDKVVLPYQPRIIVYYCGSNDINGSEKPVPIFLRVKQFCERVQVKLPDTRIYYVSINRAPQKKDRWDIVDSTNALVREFCSTGKNLGFIDVNPLLFDKENRPRMELYRSDQLHLTDRAYEEFAAVIKPIIERSWMSK